jgi:hypothetical protein
MQSDAFVSLVSKIQDAAVVPELWPIALQSLVEAFGAAGAGYQLRNRRTGSVEWLCRSGILAGSEGRMSSIMPRSKLGTIAGDSGVQVTTLRTQLSSIQRKVGVKRQSDLMRVLAGIAAIASTHE